MHATIFRRVAVKDKDAIFSIIDKGMTVDGSIVGKGNLVVKGLVKGSLTAKASLSAKRDRLRRIRKSKP